MTAVFFFFPFSSLFWNMFAEYFKVCPSKGNTKRLKNISCNRNEPKQGINTVWHITEVLNSAKQKVNRLTWTERQMYGCHEPYLKVSTHNRACTFRIFTASSSIPIVPIAVAASPISFHCSIWSFIIPSRTEPGKSLWSWRHYHRGHYSRKELTDLNFFQNRWEQ